MHRAAIPTTLTALLLLTGCGTDTPNDSGLPTIGTSSTTTTAPTTTTPTPTTNPSPWTALPTINTGPNKGIHNGVVLASSVAKTEQEKAAVEALVAFWTFAYKSSYDVKIDEVQVDKVASGAAVTNVRGYVDRLRTKNARMIGWASLNVTTVTVGQRSVLLKACVDNGSYDIDRETGKRLEETPSGYDTTAAVRDVGGRLVVTSSGSDVREKPCQKAD